MFELNDRGEVPFHNAVKCAIATLTDKTISSENDLVGVCFYGTVRLPPPSRARALLARPQPPCPSNLEKKLPLLTERAPSLGEEEQSQRL
jgi:hypothetical protein